MAFGSKELAKLLKKGGKEVIEAVTDTPTVKKATPPKAEGPKAKGSSKAKPGGPGRKRKARGVKPATPAQKAGAKKAGMGIKAFRALPQAEQKEWIKKAGKLGKPKVAPGPKRTPKEESELDRLTAQQKEEEKEIGDAEGD